MIELSTILALLGGFIGLAGWLSGRDKHICTDAEWRGSVNAKLDVIVGIKSDVARLDNILDNHAERLAAVESSAKQAHHRIEEINKKMEGI